MFSHDTSGGLFTSAADTLTKNPTNPDAKLFSVLNDRKAQPDGSFHLKLCYPELSTIKDPPCNEWTQTSNPATDSTILNFQAVNIAFDGLDQAGRTFRGLGVSPKSQAYTFINDYPEHSKWRSAIGAQQFFIQVDTIPSTSPGKLVRKVELYVETQQAWNDHF